MTDQPGAEKLQGAALAKDLFEDMGSLVQGRGSDGSADGESASDQRVVDEIESLCMNCQQDGTTRLLLTKIPFFREIVIMSFSCPHCHFHNNEIQAAGSIQEKGAKYTLKIETERDLQRQVVKSDSCLFRVEDLDLEIPAGRGQFTNVEGVLRGVMEDLSSHQEARMEQMPEVAQQVASVIQKLQDMAEGTKLPFVVSVDDPSGNSWLETRPGESAGTWSKQEYERTPAQNAALGLGDNVPQPQSDNSSVPETAIRPEYHAANMVGGEHDMLPASQNNVDSEEIVENQVYSFPASCPGCTKPCATNMKMVNIPHFKQVVLMSTVCDHCGYRSNEVKTGGEVPEKGRKIVLKVDSPEDLKRDVLKSESAALSCPELQLQVEPGTMGGRFTTVEGLLTNIRKDLRAQAFGLEDGDAPDANAGDSMTTENKRTWDEFFDQLSAAAEGRMKFTVIIQDPLASSYVQSYTAPAPDPQIDFHDYERTHEEEEDLGLNDIKTEGYQQEEEQQPAH